ncbi:MAG: alpha-L-fucosidase [Planctomycetes bacterium]|nr:alpha-L-fucosidase [Planctomycetota bacterium]
MRWLTLLVAPTVLAQAPIQVPAGASRDDVVALAATVRPTPRQLSWQRTGFNAFVHFGMNTFTDREWGDGKEAPATFAPTDFDAEQWAATFRDAGMRGVVLTCKHHDGFCLWPSSTTAHDVAASPWRDGRGDVVAELAAACRKHGLQFGVYLSPWDRSQPTFGTAAYGEVFRQQLRELCTDYGPLFEVWFDGAHCPPDDPAIFDWQAAFRLVRELQPEAAIAITGPDVRWVGNEAGRTRAEEWSVLPLRESAPGAFEDDRSSWRALWELRGRNQEPDLGGRAQLPAAKALCWWPAETDVSIRPGWFWHAAEDARVKGIGALLDCWFGAVGGNAVLLLNVPPDRRGRIAEPDARVLRDLGRYLRATFDRDLSTGAESKLYPKVQELYFDAPTTVDVFELAEDVASAGQRVERFRIEVLQNGGWRECTRGTTIGLQRLLRTEPVTGEGFRYWIERSRGKPAIARFGLYRRPQLVEPPSINRDRSGRVTITAATGEIRFTRDGSAVTAASERYSDPFELPDGGTVRAAAFVPPDAGTLALESGAEATAVFGIAPTDFRVLDCSSEQGGGEAASKAIDGDPNTHWHTRYSPDTPEPPHHLSIDLGRERTIAGFLYLPRRPETGSNGTIADYEFFGSTDGVTWRPLARGTFANVENNPVAQSVRLPAPAEHVRYVRLVSSREVRGRPWASCAELSVLAQ